MAPFFVSKVQFVLILMMQIFYKASISISQMSASSSALSNSSASPREALSITALLIIAVAAGISEGPAGSFNAVIWSTAAL